MSDALGTPGGVISDEDHRLALAGLIAAQSTSIAARTGVMWGPGTSAIITGTSATGTMTVNVGVHHWVSSRAAADGVYLGAKEASTTVNIAAAPGANSRIDVVYAKQNDAGSTISPDGSTGEFYGVVTGTAAASPVKPSLPVGAVEIGTVTVAAGATNTSGAGVTINNTAPLTVARGADVPVRSATERDALTKFTGLTVKRLDSGGRVERWDGASRWVGASPADVTLGDATFSGSFVLPTGPSWNDIASVTATSSGGLCTLRGSLSVFNGTSGADRTAIFRAVCDSTQVWISDTVSLPLNGTPTRTRFPVATSTPAAGSHTWKIQGQASAALAVIVDAAAISVVER